MPWVSSFTDVAGGAGLRLATVYGESDHKDTIVETIGCGCAFIDYDQDGWLDVFLLSGTRMSGDPGPGNRLYRNNRDGTFADVTVKAGLEHVGWASSVCVGDYNNDGWDDLFVTFWGQNILYRNNGDGTFTDVTKEAGLLETGRRWGSGCTFLDYNRDGHLDLFFANYLRFDPAAIPHPGQNANCMWKGVPVNCGPRGLPFPVHSLYRNNGNGTFSDVSEESKIAVPRNSYGMTSVACDFDNDGWPDIYVACDSSPSLLFMNHRDGTFREEALLRGVGLNEDGSEQAGMGVGLGDFNLDGAIDIFKTHFADDTNILYRNSGKGDFDDMTVASGLGVETRYVSWGAGICDFDNNGLPDIFFVTGSVYPEIEKSLPAYPLKTPRVLFRNLGQGKFEEMIGQGGAAMNEMHCSRGCAFGDFDNDGDTDILIVNLNEAPSLLRNDVSGGNAWIKVKLIGTTSNRSAIGARVEASYGKHRQAQEVASQSSFYSANDQRLHFGLGEAKMVTLEIRWPFGKSETYKDLRVNRMVTIKEGTGIVHSAGWGDNEQILPSS
ncbi:MAG: CRTAC1 family protein [Candidatus Acidiferrum sp.]